MFCGKCGKQIDDNIKFCLYCGNPIRARIMPDPNNEPVMEKPENEPESKQAVNEPAAAAPVPEPVQKPEPVKEPVQKPEPAFAPMPKTAPAPSARADVPVPAAKANAPEKREKGKKQKKKKSVLAFVFGGISLLLAAVILLMVFGVLNIAVGSGGISVSSQAASSQTASVGFGTPEEAIEYFVERIKSGDIDGALAACATSQMAENFDYEKMAERLNALMPIVNGANVPGGEYDLYASYKENTYNANILMQLSHIIYQLNSQGEHTGVIEGKPLVPIEDMDFKELIGYFDPEVLKELKIVKIDEHSMNNDERNRENQKKQADVLGGDSEDFKSVLYEYDGDYYAGGFTLIEYDGQWFIVNMVDPILGIPAYGTLVPVDSEKEFSDMLE